jgi:hypothetical protein
VLCRIPLSQSFVHHAVNGSPRKVVWIVTSRPQKKVIPIIGQGSSQSWYPARWPLGSLDRHELKEAFDRAAETRPKMAHLCYPGEIASVITEPTAALDQAIKPAAPPALQRVIKELTVACNTCHRSADRGVIVIQAPAGPPYADQDFRLVKE